MKNFQHIDALDIEAAVDGLQTPGAEAIAGGTDLMTVMKKGIREPEALINLKNIEPMKGFQDDGGDLQIGALTTITDIETSPLVNERYPVLSQAAATVGTLQLRNAGTVGGNLCQDVRCWYFRHPDVRCWLKGGDACYARYGNNRHHALFGLSACIAANPSDVAPALVVLDARARVIGPKGSREVSVESLYKLPDPDRRKQDVLDTGELIESVVIPPPPEQSTGVYLKIMERATWSFAMVSVAVQIDWEGAKVHNGRIVLGGVAGIPWRAEAAEKLLSGKEIDDALAAQVGETAVSGADPLEWNRYKVSMVKNLLKRAVLELKPPVA